MTPPISTRWRVAEVAAENLTCNLSSPPIPVLEIAENNGVDVVFADFGEHSKTVAGFCDFAEAKLYVNKDDMLERQLFTIAHELGHWVLHKAVFSANPKLYPVLPRFQEPDKKNPMEQEANHFAANLLVPRRLLSPVKDAPVSSLAKVFNVSRLMMENRLKNV